MELRGYCTMSVGELESHLLRLGGRRCGRSIYMRGGGRVLGVAHMDTVFDGSPIRYEYGRSGDFIFSPCLDDRVGVWLLAEVFSRWTDCLFTVDEERGLSSGEEFRSPCRYNWIYSFDRHGVGAVLYKYLGEAEWVRAVASHFGKVSYGSYSDIAGMRLGCCGVNVGTGYYLEHTSESFLDVRELKLQVERFFEFWKAYKDVYYPFWEPVWGGRGRKKT